MRILPGMSSFDDDTLKSRRRTLRSVSQVMGSGFLRGESEVIRRRHQQQGAPSVGHLTTLDAPVEFVSLDRHRYDIIATNTRGGRLIGPSHHLQEGGTLRLGRTTPSGRVFIMASIIQLEAARRGATEGRLVVSWEKFTGDNEDVVSLFLVGNLQVALEGRFVPMAR